MKNRRSRSACAAALLTAMLGTTALTPAHAQDRADAAQGVREFAIEAQPLMTALLEFSRQTNAPVVAPANLTAGRDAPAVLGRMDDQAALAMLLEGSNLRAVRGPSGGWAVTVSPAPQSGSAAGDGAEVEALIVTAQKKEEDIQDVPIAISAFTQKQLEAQKIEGGFDLLKAIPNVTFSKTNFSSYNFSIRGIGTKAISATTDPAVAVSFNNTPLIQNRLFEQEYFDVERVEVLRGPQGTLYGRNATAGVINVISAKPDMNDFDGWLKGEVGNYHSKRASAMVNVPLIDDVLAVRLAGAFTDRQGYDFNSITGNAVNGRDLWSARLTIGFEPTENIRANLIWERFNEDDNRSRTGKQLCHRDDGPDFVGNTPVETDDGYGQDSVVLRRALFSQGCRPGNLYDDAAFGTPNGLALPFVFGMLALQSGPNIYRLGVDENGVGATLLRVEDPYGGMMQSPDLRVIASLKDPRYEARADLLELNVDVGITPSLTFTSQTAYNEDRVYSFQDFNRFNTLPIFRDTAQITRSAKTPANPTGSGPSRWADLAPGGYFCDPQLGCSNTMVGFDISQADGKQFSQEFRLQSSFDGPVNFSVGANYTEFETVVDYYVMYNLITALALTMPFYPVALWDGGLDITMCPTSGYLTGGPPVPAGDPTASCPYIDPNPADQIDGDGHNYFRSKNPYELESKAVFGELYWHFKDDLKVTAGLRYTDDRKTFIPVPSQVLLAASGPAGGYVNKGYPADPPIKQKWGEWTGRLGLDWKPDLAATDETMLYAFYSRGYKGGGANPPTPGFASLEYTRERFKEIGFTDADLDLYEEFGIIPFLRLTAVEYGQTFEPEFVDAFEVGAKNTLLGGAMTFNMGAFFYDYKDYQVSQIRDRTAVNENFDAKTWGLEFEAMFAPSRDLQIIANLGYLDTEIADGETSIDIMNRTQGDPNYTLAKPWAQLPSNCVVPTHVAEEYLRANDYVVNFWHMCGGWTVFNLSTLVDTELGGIYDPANYPELNGGAGIRDELGGNELPNAPHWTANIGAQYGWDFLDGWRATVRGDAYWQSQSWHRVYNSDPYDKLHGWYNVNLSVWLERPDDDLKIELYAKNLLDKTPITDAFLNSDDTALTTNVFVLDPRLIGLSIRKGF